ncbi:DUF4920 domain-containing protein [bacterium (Candidatus Blackallbacteria) CG17_big_fil_post_rev_8_21_14_2_50_48_46]|uniref:DUF4920 domain-containing protein n=1 Tax=bacterium (Candidatus Blackallbacteria) CG17_big_fil_post_rev_8_21_14_2_50_48_46 TaxID=2014261 RepID=A0A2M7G8T8_9BACT|nr:MAG: DUF4920 domain-containing protein [bacterium (Candidatus Blackallbacteria) CG18_big_fil_WC_8_21_14_2_50_49_26]PIW18519.1 MAG: DUF4920 domain-containing protein [bacterium (Candidatus Blackallbacteria) CG17_big_fil_post_rev_8_21_14_2_50_48_46]PIW46496.1 MAG: DUF4920 domain-containing protein [bacterium (Candidatus Blackallbacteria) CG13_big_fil_rev_8_21_14_2_50_49_14]
MKRKIFGLLMAATLVLSQAAQAEQVLGKRPALKEVIKISTLLDHPENYLGKTIKIEGIAMDVCPTRGCWMKIKSDRKKESLLIKVDDGEMVFPMSARGKNMVIEGKLIKKMMPLKEVLELEEARAKKAGKPFDPSQFKGPRPMYMFHPTGVVVQD